MNNNNNTNRFNVPTEAQTRNFVEAFEGAGSPQELAAFFDGMRDAHGMRASARLKDGVAGVMALGRYRTGDSGHIWASWQSPRIYLNVSKLKVLFENMSKATMGACLVAIMKYYGDDFSFVLSFAKELIERRGVSPNATDFGDKKRTALHYAKDPRMVKYLVNAGAKPNARDAMGQTPLHMHYPSPARIKALLAADANPNARDANGMTPLFYHVGHPDCVKLLIRAGADPSIKNKKGDTALRFLLKRQSWWGGSTTPLEVVETIEILMAATNATNAKPSNIGNIKIANLPANIRNVVGARASLGVRRFGMTKKALNKRLNSNTTNIIMRRAFG
jgi:hypothetical protein